MALDLPRRFQSANQQCALVLLLSGGGGRFRGSSGEETIRFFCMCEIPLTPSVMQKVTRAGVLCL